MPGFVYSEMNNQSLLATILRMTDYNFNDRSPLTHPLYIIFGFILTGITCWLVFSLKDDYTDWALALILLLALIVYPSSQFFYSVLLIIPVLLLWVDREKLPIGVWGIVAFITVLYVLISFGSHVFVANIILWLAMVALLAWAILKKQSQPEISRYKGVEAS